MSIKAKPWEGGTGGATVPDASETTKGKIRIATTTESNAGTDDLTAMTPAKVKARIDAALVGGVEYKGIFNVTSATPDLSNAEKGDMYIISGTGALYGKQWVTGDHLLINEDMGGSITNSKIDKVDNTDQVTSVNGLTGAVLLSADDMAADHSASNYTPSNTTIEGHLSGVDSALGNKQPLDAQLTDVAGLTPSNNHVIIGDGSNFTASQLASTQLSDSADLARLASPALTGTPTAPTQSAGDNSTKIATTAYVDSAVTSAGGNQITDIEIKTGSTFTAEANHLYLCGYTSGTQTITFPDASSSTAGDIIGLSTQSATRAVSLVSSDGTTNDLKNNSNQTKGGTNGALSLSIHRQVSWFVSDGALWLEINEALKAVATTGAYSDLSGTPTLGTASANATTDFLQVTNNLSDLGNAGTARSNLGLVIGTDVAAIASPALTGTPTAPTATSGTNTTQLATTAFVQSAVTSAGGVTSVNGSTGAVTISGDDLAADHLASNYTATNANIDGHLSGIDTALGARQPLDAQLTDVAGLTPSNNYVIIGDGSNFTASQLASTQLSDSADLARLASPALTGTPTAPTATSGTNTTQIATTAFVQSAVTSAGGLSAVVDDTSPQLGGDLDVNGQSITSASGGNVVINPDGAGTINLGADTIPDADATHDLGTESARFAEIHGELEGAVMFKARNETGGSLTKGQAVYISGLSGSTPLISLAQSNSASTMQAFGLLAANVSNNADVKVITFGNLTNIDTSSFSAGDTVFISSTVAGGLVSSAPTGTANLIQNIGKVVRSHASAGIIKVGGAGRTNATPNLNQNQVFLGNASNQAVATSISSINLTSFNDDLGSTYQPLDAQLTDVAGLTPSNGAFIVGDSSNFVTESGATARASLGLVIGTNVLGDVVDDTTPQLGGNLDTNGQDIVTTSNADLDLAPDGTGVVVVRGNQTGGNNQGAIKLNCEQNSHGVTIKAPAHSATATYTLTLPTSDGSPDQVLKTDGSGVLSWVDQASGGGGWTYSAITADPANAQVSYHYSCTGTFTATLPAVSGTSAGDEIRFKNMGTGDITIDGNGSETVDGSLTYVMNIQYESITCVSTGSAWEIV